jgi:phosphohistidine phosphatase
MKEAAVARPAAELPAEWLRWRRALLGRADPRSVHEFRRCSQRLLATLDLAAADGELIRHVRRAARRAAPLRDAHVLHLLAAELLSGWPTLPDFQRWLRPGRKKAAALTAALRLIPPWQVADGLDPSHLLSPGAAARLEQWRDHLALGLSTGLPMEMEALHQLRLALKRWRHARDRLAAAGAVATPAPDSATRLQSLLGALHDGDVLQSRLDAFLARQGGPAPDLRPMTKRRQNLLAEARATAVILARELAEPVVGPPVSVEKEVFIVEWILLRHGPAGKAAADPGADDRERPLTRPGLQVVRQVCRKAVRQGWTAPLVLSSPLARALQTAEAAVEALGPGTRLELLAELEPDGGLPELVAALAGIARREKAERLWLVGHEPQLSRLASLLISGTVHAGIELRKGGLIRLAAEDLQARKCARLLAHWEPRGRSRRV